MPTLPLEEPTTKVTLNIFTRDLEALKRIGAWSALVREIVHEWMENERGKQRRSDLHNRT